MRTLSVAMATAIAQDLTTLTTCWRVTRTDGQTFGFTAHDADLTFGGVTYAASTGITPTAVEKQTRLAVDNLEAMGVFDSAAITDDDLRAGVWDYARIEVYIVDWSNPANASEPINVGRIGEVRSDSATFTAELRGLAEAYGQTIGATYQPACRATFCDARCGLNAGDYTVTGTIDDASATGLVLFDAARTEPGPTGGKAITGITKSAAPTFTCASHGFTAGQVFYVAGVLGMVEVNGLTLSVASVINGNSFVAYGVDTTAFSTYVSGGTATPQGDVGYFDGGTITMTSGAAAGLSMEVKAYSPGVITLQLPFARAVGAGDTYSMLAGCGKRFKEDCIDRFDNGINFRGEPHVPGMDRLVWVGGQER